MLELAILGLLEERPMHGYDLRKRLRDELGPFANLSFGSLYPALARLERTGAIESVQADAARGEGALGGRGTRARKVYALTERGELYFEELLEASDSGDDPRSFILRLGFARHLTPAARLRLLERRRLQLLDRVERAERQLARRRSTLDRYTTSIARHSLDLAHADLAWVEELLADERSSSDSADARAAAQASSPGSAPGALAGILHAGRLRRRGEPVRTSTSTTQPLTRHEPQSLTRPEPSQKESTPR